MTTVEEDRTQARIDGLLQVLRDTEADFRRSYARVLDVVAELDAEKAGAVAGFGTTAQLLAGVLNLSKGETKVRAEQAGLLAPGIAGHRHGTGRRCNRPRSRSGDHRHLDPDGKAPAEEPETMRELRFRTGSDGVVSLTGKLDPEGGARVLEVLGSLNDRRSAVDGVPDLRDRRTARRTHPTRPRMRLPRLRSPTPLLPRPPHYSVAGRRRQRNYPTRPLPNCTYGH